jgi:hypothetical protein
MPSDHELRSYASECVRLARLADDPHIRERLLQIAREWMAVAVHEESAPESA